MKKLILLAAIVILSGCASIKPTQRAIYTDFADYRAYSEIGFLITPNAYSGEFESLGEIAIHIIPAITKTTEKYMGEDWNFYDYEVIKRQELIDIAVKEAIDRGADAITDFAITSKEIIKGDGMGKVCSGYEYWITGFCIKRK